LTEFWEEAFKSKQEMWGFIPAQSAIEAKDFFVRQQVKNILIPGIGYGRNAQVFVDNGLTVTGIEISKTAIALAEKHFGSSLNIHHGSVTQMPFDDKQYDGIFCYALIHLLDIDQRSKLLHDCYSQLADNGFLIFTTITKAAHTYGQGREIGKNRFEMFGGVNMFFYDHESILEEFGVYGLIDVKEIEENYPFYVITCQKKTID